MSANQRLHSEASVEMHHTDAADLGVRVQLQKFGKENVESPNPEENALQKNEDLRFSLLLPELTPQSFVNKQALTPLQRLLKSISNPSITAGVLVVAILALLVSSVCITVTSEVMYRNTLSSFAESAINSVVTRVVLETAKGLKEIEVTADTITFASRVDGRQVPSVEESSLLSSGIVSPLGPSVANISTGTFDVRLGSRLPNSTAIVSTWRNYYGSKMASLKMSSSIYYDNFDVVFADGAYVRMETQSALNLLQKRPVLTDGILLPNSSQYYTRRSAVDGVDFSYSTSRIIPSSLSDRRTEAWYTMKLDSSDIVINPARKWGGLGINVTTGSAWINLVSLVTSASGTIGRLRLSYSLDLMGWFPQEYRDWIPMHSVQIFIIALDSEVIFGTPSFSEDPLRSLHTSYVGLAYSLTTEDLQASCVLSPFDSVTKKKTCRHTISSYGNDKLNAAWNVEKGQYSSSSFFAPSSESSAASGKTAFDSPKYKSFSVAGEHFYVSTVPVPFETQHNPQLVTLVYAPQSEVTGVLTDVRNIVIAVTVAIIVLCSLLVIIGSHMVLSPLSDVSQHMSLAAYLHDHTATPDSSITAIHQAERALLIQKMMLERKPSRWGEVKTIQEAYWALSDELQTLKAYIPEHVRLEVMEKHLKDREASGGMLVPGQVVHTSKEKEEEEAGPSEMDDRSSVMPEAYLKGHAIDTEEHDGAALIHILPETQQGNLSAANNTETDVPVFVPPPGEFPPPPTQRKKSGTPKQFSVNILLPPSATPNQNTSSQHKPSLTPSDTPSPIVFADSSLIDRMITVVQINIIGFHSYARRRHPMDISSDFAAFIGYINSEAKRFGGVLESFFSDKIWVSFNATTMCDHHQIAACYFGHSVTTVANRTSVRYKLALATPEPTDGSKKLYPTVDARFSICLSGLTCGIATGPAFVGPLGNSSIKRHAIISNAISEAAALERQAMHYSGCNVIISNDMIPYIERYVQYLIFDVSTLPGTSPNNVAVVKGPMLGIGANAQVVKRWLKQTDETNFVFPIESPSIVHCEHRRVLSKRELQRSFVDMLVPRESMFATINAAFRAYRRCEIEKAVQKMNETVAQVQCLSCDRPEFSEELNDHRASIHLVYQMIHGLLSLPTIDPRQYASTLGRIHVPAFARTLFLANPAPVEVTATIPSNDELEIIGAVFATGNPHV